MDSDIDSEATDFWQEFNDRGESPLNLSPDPKYPNNSSMHIPSLFKQNFEESVKVLRELKYDEEICARLDEQATMRNYIKFSIDRLKAKFKQDTASKIAENDIMKRQMYHDSKDKQILWSYLIDQEVYITQFKNQAKLSRTQNSPIQLKNHFIERNKLYKEIDLLKIKTEALLRARVNIEKECEINKLKLGTLVLELESIKKTVFQEFSELEKQNLDLLNAKKMDNVILMREYQEFKRKKLKELDDYENTCAKNTELIMSLQAELKSAKTVLKKPELRIKVYERLQDYIDNFDEDENSAPPSISKNNSIHRRRVYSNKAISAGNISGIDINKGASPKVSNFKFYSRKPTLHSSRPSTSKNLNLQSSGTIRLLSAGPRNKK